MILDRTAFILGNTRLQTPPHCPEIVLHLADEVTPIWRMTEEALSEIGLPPPFWAFAWAGGQAVARYVLDHPQVVTTAISLWKAMRSALLESVRDREGAVRRRLLREVSSFGEQLRTEESLRARLDSAIADVTVFMVERYGAELTTVITHTIERWDGKEAARRIELHVGRDLQFIRINGTIVGGLVGVLIHAFSVLAT